MNKQITVKVSPLGKATVEAHGFQGQGCEAATQGIEQALAGGSGEVTREIKEEWNNVEDSQQQELHQKW